MTTPSLVCNLTAIDAQDRARYHELAGLLRSAIVERTEDPAGFTYRLDRETISLVQVAEWIGMENLCCPFLKFELSVSQAVQLRLAGPAGVKDILRAAFDEPG